MAEALNQAQTPTLQGTIPTLEQALQQAAQGLPPEALQQALGMGKAYDPLLAEQAARRTAELKPAEEAAKAAEQAYQRQSAAPAPEVSGARAGLNEILGSVASILSGNQTYRESAATRLQKEQQALLDSRSQNLTRLKDLYDKRAEAAKSLGNDIAEEENRIKKDRIEKALEPINKAREHQYQMQESAAREGSLKRDRQASQLVNQATIRWSKPSQDMETITDYRNQIMQTSEDSVGDLLMLRFLARISDPRTGVREQEFETFKRAEGELKRVFNAPRSWFGQGMLTPEGRRALRAEAEKMFRQKLSSFDARREQVRAMYIRQGMDPLDADTAIYDVVGPYRDGLSATEKALGLEGKVYSGVRKSSGTSTESGTGKSASPEPSGLTKEKLAALKTRKG